MRENRVACSPASSLVRRGPFFSIAFSPFLAGNAPGGASARRGPRRIPEGPGGAHTKRRPGAGGAAADSRGGRGRRRQGPAAAAAAAPPASGIAAAGEGGRARAKKKTNSARISRPAGRPGRSWDAAAGGGAGGGGARRMRVAESRIPATLCGGRGGWRRGPQGPRPKPAPGECRIGAPPRHAAAYPSRSSSASDTSFLASAYGSPGTAPSRSS